MRIVLYLKPLLLWLVLIHVESINCPVSGTKTVGLLHLCSVVYCITRIFRVEEIFAIFANFDFARNFPPAK